MEPVIRIEELSQVYSGGWGVPVGKAIDSLSLELQAGQVLGVLGGNGSGKSTLLKSLCGLLPVPTGCVRISGRDPSRAIHRDNVGYLPERPAFPSYQTPRKFLMHLARLIGVAGEPLKARVNICLEQCDIQKSADTKIEQMSKGGIQRLAMAQALLHNPDVLLMDEPMDGLDPLARENYTSHIRRLADGGKTIVLATHLLDGLELISDQLLVLHQGRCIFMGPPMFESELKAWLLERLRQGEGNGD